MLWGLHGINLIRAHSFSLVSVHHIRFSMLTWVKMVSKSNEMLALTFQLKFSEFRHEMHVFWFGSRKLGVDGPQVFVAHHSSQCASQTHLAAAGQGWLRAGCL